MKNYLPDVIETFHSYKSLAEKAKVQVSDEEFFWQIDAESNLFSSKKNSVKEQNHAELRFLLNLNS